MSAGSRSLLSRFLTRFLTRFLRAEREGAGWRFWVLWMLATNAGFFAGLGLGRALAAHASGALASGIVGASFGALTGAAQAWALRRHIDPRWWTAGTALGWGAGGALGALLLARLAPGADPAAVPWSLAVGALGGALVGVPQRVALRHADPYLARAWIPISALAWGVLFPGAISGLFLALRLSRRARRPDAGVS